MKALALRELPIRHLEHLFVPPGLPLVSKGQGVPPTTSVLIRGGAGAGKTTLALALGLGIARAGDGTVLYLTTEFSQAELLYKARLLGVGEAAVLPWADRGQAGPGSVVTEHLTLRAPEEGELTSAARKESAIEVVWDLLRGGREAPPAVPVRSVVIDAFALPDAEAEDPTLRSYLVAFLQGLEKEGISTVLVEESVPGTTSWLPFVVDLVFELEWAADPDSGALGRRLRCPKSRYARALAGPHEYGLEGGVPGVWPDLLAVAATAGVEPGMQATSPAAWIYPLGEHYARFTRGGIIVAPEHHSPLLRTLHRTPGVVAVEVRCGNVTSISGPMLSADVRLFDVGDFQDLGWALLGLVREHDVNTVVFLGVEPSIRRPHLQIELLHLLEALRALGVLVVVRAKPEGVAALSSLSDLSVGEGVPRNQVVWPLIDLRSAALWLDAPEWPGARAAWDHEIPDGSGVQGPLWVHRDAILGLASKKQWQQVRGKLGGLQTVLQQKSLGPGVLFGVELLLCQIGVHGAAPLTLRGRSAPHQGDAFLWLSVLLGREHDASNEMLSDFNSGTEAPHAGLVWAALCAVHARSAAALARLAKAGEVPEEPWLLALWLRALTAQGRAIPKEVANRVADQHVLRRLDAETMLYAVDEASRRIGRERLAEVARDATVPRLHRADAAHNVAVAYEQEGDREAAIRTYQMALGINPLLEAARSRAGRLGVSIPPLR